MFGSRWVVAVVCSVFDFLLPLQLLTDGDSSEEDAPLARCKRPRPLSGTASPGSTSPAPFSSSPKKTASCSPSPVSSPLSHSAGRIPTGDLVKNVRTKIEDELSGRNCASSSFSSSPSPMGSNNAVGPALSPISPSPSPAPSPGYLVNGSLSESSALLVKADKKEGETHAHCPGRNFKMKHEEGDPGGAQSDVQGESLVSREVKAEPASAVVVGLAKGVLPVKKEDAKESGGGGAARVGPRSGAVSPAGLGPGASVAPKKKVSRFVKTEENFEPINRWWERSEAEIEREQEKQVRLSGMAHCRRSVSQFSTCACLRVRVRPVVPYGQPASV